jgi:ferritin-like metal-binding protein YciE
MRPDEVNMKLESLEKLYIDELRDLYSAENQLVAALPKAAQAAASPELRRAIEEHLAQTEVHVQRLERLFEDLGFSPAGHACKAMQGLVGEVEDLIGKDDADPAVRDAGLIAQAQRIEHYEIAGYGCVRTYARLLGHEEQAQILRQTLDEEGDTDKKLTELAESTINIEAAGS